FSRDWSSDVCYSDLPGPDDLPDGPRDRVLGIVQHHVELPLAAGLDLDEVTKAERLVLVAVGDDDVEIGAHHRGLVAVGRLERDGSNAVEPRGFLLRFPVAG